MLYPLRAYDKLYAEKLWRESQFTRSLDAFEQLLEKYKFERKP